MNRKIILLLLIIFQLVLTEIGLSQANKINPNGYNKFYYGNGQLSSEGKMRNSKPDGYWKTYYINGLVKSEGNRKNFMLDSVWVFYDEDGNITKKISYKEDKKNGHYEVYIVTKDTLSRNVMISQELYLNDLKQGLSYYYYENRKLHLKIYFQDNRKHGDAWEYDKDGNIISELKYRNDVLIAKSRINRYNSEGNKNGTWKYFYPSGKLKSEAYYKNGRIDGYLKEYTEKGKLLSSKRYIEGELYEPKIDPADKAEVKKEFYDNGKVKTSGAYKENIPVGQHSTYSETGKVLQTIKYSTKGTKLYEGIVDARGKRQGDWKYFYLSGNTKSTGRYSNSRRVGAWNFYFENGKKEQEGQYNNKGKPTGTWKWYHDNGNLLREEIFENGKENGLMVEYNRNGDIIAKGEFIDGMKEGAWYYNIGDEVQEGSYKADFKDGEWIHHFPDKTLKFVGSYVDGEEQGKHKYYYQDGKLKMEGEFSMGKRHNQWKFYNEDGILRTTITYRLDQEIKIDGVKLKEKKGK